MKIPVYAGKVIPTVQTAWGIWALVNAGHANHPAVARAVRFLLSRQKGHAPGTESQFTGTGFPRVRSGHHLYRIYFPLMALSRRMVAAQRLPPVKATADTAIVPHAIAGVKRPSLTLS